MKLKRLPKLSPDIGKLKPFKFPEGFCLIIDTREQLPLFETPIDNLDIIHRKVEYGDYTIKGFESSFAIERKQISDFYSYIGRERNKTVEKMRQFREIRKAGGFVMLAIESSEEDILFGHMYSQLSPETARQALASFRIRYGVHIYCNRDRKEIERTILDCAIKFYKVMREV